MHCIRPSLTKCQTFSNAKAKLFKNNCAKKITNTCFTKYCMTSRITCWFYHQTRFKARRLLLHQVFWLLKTDKLQWNVQNGHFRWQNIRYKLSKCPNSVRNTAVFISGTIRTRGIKPCFVDSSNSHYHHCNSCNTFCKDKQRYKKTQFFLLQDKQAICESKITKTILFAVSELKKQHVTLGNAENIACLYLTKFWQYLFVVQ